MKSGARDSKLLEVLQRGFDASRARAGENLACAPGCDRCCHGPFPITRLDAWRLRRGMASLTARDPALARSVRDRARQSVARLAPGFPGDAQSGRPAADEARLDAHFARHADEACPALDPGTGTCDLYAWRPVACRTFGPPLRFEDRSSPHCELCFRDAGPELVEACRYRPDPDGLESTILRSMGATPGREWETMIAHTLADDRWGTPKRDADLLFSTDPSSGRP